MPAHPTLTVSSASHTYLLMIMQRLEPVITEMERERECVAIVSHQAVLRVVYGYFMVGREQWRRRGRGAGGSDACDVRDVPSCRVVEWTGAGCDNLSLNEMVKDGESPTCAGRAARQDPLAGDPAAHAH